MSKALYPVRPVVEARIMGEIKLLHEIEVKTLRLLSDFERIKYSKRILEAKKRSMDVATIDGKYLKWNQYHKENISK